jgi:hypothetical protein
MISTENYGVDVQWDDSERHIVVVVIEIGQRPQVAKVPQIRMAIEEAEVLTDVLEQTGPGQSLAQVGRHLPDDVRHTDLLANAVAEMTPKDKGNLVGSLRNMTSGLRPKRDRIRQGLTP